MREEKKAKEKAEELILKFMRLQERNYNWFDSKLAKKCALIAVDEMLYNYGWSPSREVWARFKKYCEEVKQEIEKL